jgi:hypothetical protein
MNKFLRVEHTTTKTCTIPYASVSSFGYDSDSGITQILMSSGIEITLSGSDSVKFEKEYLDFING